MQNGYITNNSSFQRARKFSENLNTFISTSKKYYRFLHIHFENLGIHTFPECLNFVQRSYFPLSRINMISVILRINVKYLSKNFYTLNNLHIKFWVPKSTNLTWVKTKTSISVHCNNLSIKEKYQGEAAKSK